MHTDNKEGPPIVWCVLNEVSKEYSIIGVFNQTITVRVLTNSDTVGVPQDFLEFTYNKKKRLFTVKEIDNLPIAIQEDDNPIIKLFGDMYTYNQQMEYGIWLKNNKDSIEGFFDYTSDTNYSFVQNCNAISEAIIMQRADTNNQDIMSQSREAWEQGLYNNLYDNVMLFQQKYQRRSIPELIKLVDEMNRKIKNLLIKHKIETLNYGPVTEYDKQSDSNFKSDSQGNIFKQYRDLYISHYDSQLAKTLTFTKGISNSDAVIELMQNDYDNHIKTVIKNNDKKTKEAEQAEAARAEAARAEAARAAAAAASAAAAPSSWGSNISNSIFEFGNQAGNQAVNAAKYLGSTGVNWAIAKSDMPVGQYKEGIQFDRNKPYTQVAPLSDNLAAVYMTARLLHGREIERKQNAERLGKEYVPRSWNEIASEAGKRAYREKDTSGGKRKSKKSKKSKKSRKSLKK